MEIGYFLEKKKEASVTTSFGWIWPAVSFVQLNFRIFVSSVSVDEIK